MESLIGSELCVRMKEKLHSLIKTVCRLMLFPGLLASVGSSTTLSWRSGSAHRATRSPASPPPCSLSLNRLRYEDMK